MRINPIQNDCTLRGGKKKKNLNPEQEKNAKNTKPALQILTVQQQRKEGKNGRRKKKRESDRKDKKRERKKNAYQKKRGSLEIILTERE